MAAVQTQVSWSQPWHSQVYRGLVCNPLMSEIWSDRTPLHEAALHGRLLHLRSLIARGFHVNTLTLDGVSPLHEACLRGHYACAKFLVDHGANVNVTTTDGATPLFYSCRSGSAACVRLLLDHQASIRISHHLTSPVHEAAGKDHRECLELLLSHGAEVDLELPAVGTPLYSACKGSAAACVDLLLHLGADVRLGCGLETPLHAATGAGDPSLVDLLLEFGAGECCKNADGKTPLGLTQPNTAVRAALQSRVPGSLFQLCRLGIRRSLGRSRFQKASSLFLPDSITDFILYR
ncbi:ankyrin repeat and SOCS box protein 11 isoform X1 [Synchiropus splendidus]|uniref:ankyrin repeat and SOCS box protein 11 isoform X1 n=1 Tax=Synchiropus splendidus TaxID=270530 RepID=UPI00237D5287|nr:ankyrin repeat and SOCS box protein 11 isoform X1 [Synchiropus splendidus]